MSSHKHKYDTLSLSVGKIIDLQLRFKHIRLSTHCEYGKVSTQFSQQSLAFNFHIFQLSFPVFPSFNFQYYNVQCLIIVYN